MSGTKGITHYSLETKQLAIQLHEQDRHPTKDGVCPVRYLATEALSFFVNPDGLPSLEMTAVFYVARDGDRRAFFCR